MKINISQFINVDWEKIVGRKTDLQKAISFSLFDVGGLGKYFSKKNLSKQLYYFDGRTTSIYFSKKEYASFLKKVYKKLENVNFIKKLERKILFVSEDSLDKSKKLSSLINQKTTSKELLKIYQQFENILNTFYPVAWAFFFIAGFENVIERKLLKYGFSKKEIEDILKISSQPRKITPVIEAEIETLKLAKFIKEKSEKIETRAKKLSDKYGWMSVYNTDDFIRDSSYYIKEAHEMINTDIDKKLKTFKKEKEKNEIKFKEIIKKISNPLLKEQLKFIHLSGFLRDKREEVRDKLTIYQKPLYQSIAKTYNLSLGEVINLTKNEIKDLLNSSKINKDFKKKIKKRLERYMFIIENSNIVVLDSDADIKKIANKIKINDDAKKIKGQIAYKSFPIKGIVKIILSNKELNKIKNGDILVSTMTKPDYLTTMKKAKAFITDEGGITCHAAIVARELKKSCIIGTKIATKVLKDGDLVEVDAEKGIVKIIKKAIHLNRL